MVTRIRLKLNRKAMGDVALRSNEVKAMIEARTHAGAEAAAGASGEETFPEVSRGKERWYGTYGVTDHAESTTGAASGSVGSI